MTALAACAPDGDDPAGDPAAEPITPAPATLHRLTVSQYHATVRALFGQGIKVPTDLEADTALHGFSSIGGSELTVSPLAAERYEAAALSLARQVFGDAGRRAALLGCAPQSIADACVRDFLARFGLRAFRRPLSTQEIDKLRALAASLAASLGSPLAGLEYTVVAMLQSPHFLFRVELGEPDPEDPDRPDRRRYTGYEMASRLSYFLWNGPPDDELLKAAADGRLGSKEGVLQQGRRMLDDPRARAAILGFFQEYFNLARLESVSKDKKLFPSFTPALIAAMREEILRGVDDLVFSRDADYREILRATTAFVNADLARLYGVPAPAAGFAQVALPEAGGRGGLLGTAGILALNAHATTTSPTHRGRFVRAYLLCQNIPPPPPGVSTSLEPPMGGGPVTLRQLLEKHRQDPACRGCHQRMDPIGLGLERFDPIGALRDKDNGLPVDARSDLDGAPFEGPRQLGELLAGERGLATCLSRQLYRHATGHIEDPAEDPAIQALGEGVERDGFRVKALVLALLQSDGFRLAGPARE